ncbi:MAG TPA: FAD-dependent monooxygenase, partial [Burkholderiaceae bacterium]|nr:FAD-dependent monooxygenase [Burkholderiaceae bacterium]
MQHVDLAILGAGPVGQTLALLLARTTHARIALIDKHGPERARSDPRAIALSHGSLQLLARVLDVDALPRAPILEVHVTQSQYLGRALLRARDEGVEMLGAVVRYADLMKALNAALVRLGDASNIVWRQPTEVVSLKETSDGVAWQDAFGEADAALAARVEGGLFDEANLGRVQPETRTDRDLRRDYAQTAVVCEVECTTPISGAAFERFGRYGPLALLPVPEPRRYSLVWCSSADEAS